MGMGEPLLNYRNVLDSIEKITSRKDGFIKVIGKGDKERLIPMGNVTSSRTSFIIIDPQNERYDIIPYNLDWAIHDLRIARET
ncbi:hypothetical protein N9Y26_00265 [bacterium]|nr:hypothetical protein [bacterium]